MVMLRRARDGVSLDFGSYHLLMTSMRDGEKVALLSIT